MSIDIIENLRGNRYARNSMSIEIGARLRTLRFLHGVTQEELAEKMEVSFQAVQKWEAGEVNIAIVRLFRICKIFGVDWSHFLDPLPDTGKPAFAPRLRSTIELIEAFETITDGNTRRTLISLAEALAEKSQ